MKYFNHCLRMMQLHPQPQTATFLQSW